MIRKREVARRVFAYELIRSIHQIGDEGERSPKYVLTPTGERVNRIFSVAALLDKEEIRPDSNIWRLRLSDPTGVYYAYVGRFQPEALETVIEIEAPELVAIVGKVRVFEGMKKLVSVRPENIVPVEIEVRDYWVIETAKRTLERIKAMENEEDEDAKLAMKIYSPNLEEYKNMVKQAVSAIREEIKVFEEEKSEEEIEEFEFEFEEEEWDLSDLLEE